MSSVITNCSSCEIRSVIRFLTARGYNAAEIHRQLCETYGPNVMSDGKVRQWCREFKEGRSNVHDEQRSGRRSVRTDDLVERVNAKVRDNRRFTIRSISAEFPEVSRTTLLRIVTDTLSYRKLCARWVPKTLTDADKDQRIIFARAFLDRFSREGCDFLSRLVTGDETCLSLEGPEARQFSDSPDPKIPRYELSSFKIVATIYWDRHGVLLLDFSETLPSVTTQGYCGTLSRLRRAVQHRRQGMYNSGVVLLHDNTHPVHTSSVAVETMEKFGWELFSNPPYSPDLAPSDYHLFRHLKNWLASKRFEDVGELKASVENWLKSQTTEFYAQGLNRLISQYQKCLERDGDYVE
ncbi:UNVERIFIED_CONTAM: hypothetical protein PYX00_010659 [Menopon gallinae]|uniref:Mos1 transposase HTH domain-containing protein n=1 Tax=Menopon gallinae TaxID=328185 RepID=A0AAW2HGY2_9NEOP